MASEFITCGMYAFTPVLREAWQALFDEFLQLNDSRESIESAIRFDSDYNALKQPGLFIGHTCGYPLMRYLQQYCSPVCVPVFDVEGCNGKYYSSRFIVAPDSDISEIRHCRNHVAAINSHDSNSGMNVLRHAVAQCGQPPPFFSSVIETGSHFNSLQAVAEGRADIASIDCVSYALIHDERPRITAQVKTLGYSAATCGLPLVTSKTGQYCDSDTMLQRLNEALGRLPESHRKTLHLDRFSSVSWNDYQGIIDMEADGNRAGYSLLR